MLSFFAELVTRTDEDRRAFETNPVVVDAVARGMPVERYRALLLELYHVVWHFNPVCAAAASRMGDEHMAVRHFLYEHMQEESGHEVWVMNDLEAIGVAADAVRQHAPAAHTLALNGYNYWAADAATPVRHWACCTRWRSSPRSTAGRLRRRSANRFCSKANAAVSFIGSHASLDAQHMADLRRLMNQLNSAGTLAAVVESVRVNFHHFTRIIEAI